MAFGKETIQVRKPIRAVSKADGNMDGLYPDHLRQSDFIVENMTIVNNAANTTDNVDRMQDVIKSTSRCESYYQECISERYRRNNRFDRYEGQ